MSSPILDPEELAPDVRTRHEQLIGRFETAWRRGECPTIEAFLPTEAADRETVLVELVHADLEYRLKVGEPVRVETYLERYPEVADDPEAVLQLIGAEYELRRRCEPALLPEEYQRRFPRHAVPLIQALARPASPAGRGLHDRETRIGTTEFEKGDETPGSLPGKMNLPHFLIDANPLASSDQDNQEGYDFLDPPQSPDELGRLGPYRVLKVLGVGAMGVVFQAEDLQLRRPVALKVMRPTLARNAACRHRFLREAWATAAVSHDHIVAIHQVGEHEGIPFLTMPLLQGESLEARLQREGRLPLGEVLCLGRQIASGLAAAHRQGLIHRDIKPANLWLETGPGETGTSAAPLRVKILDFGLVYGDANSLYETLLGVLVGTPAYMAPEQAEGPVVDARADLFSLGCVLYRMITGRPPFEGASVLQVLYKLANSEPLPPHEVSPEVPAEVGKFIQCMLSKKPEDRPVSADVVMRVLDTLQQKHTSCSLDLVVPCDKKAQTPDTVTLPMGGKSVFSRWTIRRNAGMAAAVLLLLVGSLVAAICLGGAGGEKLEHPSPLPGDDSPPPPPIETGKPLEPTAYVARPAVIKGLRSWLLNTSDKEVPVEEMCLLGDDILALKIGRDRWVHWDFSKSELVPAPLGGSYAAMSADRKYAAVVDAPIVKLFKEGKPTYTLKGHSKQIREVQFSPDVYHLATVGSEGIVFFWNTESGNRVGMCELEVDNIVLYHWTTDGKTLAVRVTTAPLAGVGLISFRKSTNPRIIPVPGAVSSAALSPDERLLAAACSDERVHLFDVKSAKELHILKAQASPNFSKLAWSRDSKFLAFAGVQQNILLYDLSGKKPELEAELFGHDRLPLALLFAPDGQTLISSSQDGSVRFWDLKRKQQRGSLLILDVGKWLAVSAAGHYRCCKGCEESLFYKVETEAGVEPEMKADVFRKRFGWKNEPDYVRLLDEAYRKSRREQEK